MDSHRSQRLGGGEGIGRSQASKVGGRGGEWLVTGLKGWGEGRGVDGHRPQRLGGGEGSG